MRITRIQRIVRKQKANQTSRGCLSLLQFARDFFARENHLEFAIEALLFGVLIVISAWPIVAAADAINRFL
jgi:hypothetical protein